jgi:hypothetical protein
VANAPEQVVQGFREKLEFASAKLAQLREARQGLS